MMYVFGQNKQVTITATYRFVLILQLSGSRIRHNVVLFLLITTKFTVSLTDYHYYHNNFTKNA
jgi:hypothetical protein